MLFLGTPKRTRFYTPSPNIYAKTNFQNGLRWPYWVSNGRSGPIFSYFVPFNTVPPQKMCHLGPRRKIAAPRPGSKMGRGHFRRANRKFIWTKNCNSLNLAMGINFLFDKIKQKCDIFIFLVFWAKWLPGVEILIFENLLHKSRSR